MYAWCPSCFLLVFLVCIVRVHWFGMSINSLYHCIMRSRMCFFCRFCLCFGFYEVFFLFSLTFPVLDILIYFFCWDCWFLGLLLVVLVFPLMCCCCRGLCSIVRLLGGWLFLGICLLFGLSSRVFCSRLGIFFGSIFCLWWLL